MASTNKCEYCGAIITSADRICPNCGAANPLYVVDQPRVILAPHTIQELQEYCAERGMPLERMRFYIGVDFKEPRAFGVYHDETTGSYITYKNKDSGERAIRYIGPDEERAVTELYTKLLDECHKRNIWPDTVDGKPPKEVVEAKKDTFRKGCLTILVGIGALIVLFFGIDAILSLPARILGSVGYGILALICSYVGLGLLALIIWPDKNAAAVNKRKRVLIVTAISLIIALLFGVQRYNSPGGYYNVNGVYYYRQGTDNYYFSDSSDTWYSYDGTLDSDYYVGGDYSDEWDLDYYDRFEQSDDYYGNSGSDYSSSDYSSDYDSWDSGSTDWSSDW